MDIDEFGDDLGDGSDLQATGHGMARSLEAKDKFKAKRAWKRLRTKPKEFLVKDVIGPELKFGALVGVFSYWLATAGERIGHIEAPDYGSIAIAAALAMPVIKTLNYAGQTLGNIRGHFANATREGSYFQQIDDRAELRGVMGTLGFLTLCVGGALGFSDVAQYPASMGMNILDWGGTVIEVITEGVKSVNTPNAPAPQ
ncbi:MAG: hypothetical protein CMH32_06515 [Micavibrio sp.]|nr:hypothetical protein [Micavibrio sp.]HCK33427.1 hypothetical protein [Rhodospirillaceae bacterium]|tara:strand:- start:890 stop:1486 length:597 start_codon:yes stop_codon:yes gene_type:complete